MNEIKYKLSDEGCSITGYEIPEIEIPEGVTAIENHVFHEATFLKKVILPSTMTTINVGAFADCINLEEITFPAALSFLGDAAFYNCSSLKRVNIEVGNDHFVVVNGILYTSDMSEMIRALDSPENSHIILTEKQKASHTGALRGCPSLTHFTFARKVGGVGDGFFAGCENLKQVDLVDGMLRIGAESFRNTDIETIDLPKSIQEIACGAFAECYSLRHITIPENVKRLQSYTFKGCDSLETVELGNKMYLIDEEAFEDVSYDLEIIVPENKTIAMYYSYSEIEDYVTKHINDDSESDLLFAPFDLIYFIFGGNKFLEPKETIEMLRQIDSDDSDDDHDDVNKNGGDNDDYLSSLDNDDPSKSLEDKQLDSSSLSNESKDDASSPCSCESIDDYPFGLPNSDNSNEHLPF